MTPSASPSHILVMDDEPDVLDLYCDVLGSAGYAVLGVSSIDDAQRYLRTHRVDLLLSDILMADGHGTELVASLRARLRAEGTRIVFATGAPWYQGVSEALDADLFLMKPFNADLLLQFVERLLGPAAP